MAVNGVEEPGEGQAEDGSQEKHPDHHLLLNRSHERHVGPEHVHEAQTEEEEAAWGGRGSSASTINTQQAAQYPRSAARWRQNHNSSC